MPLQLDDRPHLMRNLLGWTASAILVMTIASQIFRQWKASTSKGVSIWLFGGQMTASAGFIAYSVLLHDTVFIFTNAIMFVAAVIGLGMVIVHRHRGK
jgi:uncharacterized protein with PQ loop repeat